MVEETEGEDLEEEGGVIGTGSNRATRSSKILSSINSLSKISNKIKVVSIPSTAIWFCPWSDASSLGIPRGLPLVSSTAV
jgi:hypothetical protein